MLIVDRIEDGTAVIENEDKHFEVPVSKLGADVREGDDLRKRDIYKRYCRFGKASERNYKTAERTLGIT